MIELSEPLKSEIKSVNLADKLKKSACKKCPWQKKVLLDCDGHQPIGKTKIIKGFNVSINVICLSERDIRRIQKLLD